MTETELALLLHAVEFGYKAHEKGENIQQALSKFKQIMKVGQ